MDKISVYDIIEHTNGTIYYGDESAVTTVYVDSVSSNSLEIEAGALFIPIIGERVNAHRFVAGALESGAVVSLISEDIDTEMIPADKYCIKVDDTLRAFQRLAAWYRSRYNIPVIAVTGSVGKTTTKEMIATALSPAGKVLKTIGNRNSQLGVALMMFEMDQSYDVAVIEMGISEPEEMKHLTAMAAPQSAVVTNIGVSHMEMLGSRDNIRREKLDVVRGFGESGGKLYVCGDNDMLHSLSSDSAMDETIVLTKEARKKLYVSEVHTYGSGPDCSFRAVDICQKNEGISFVYEYGNGEAFPVNLGVDGIHNVCNAVIALTIALEYGVDINKAIAALEEYKPLSMRGQVIMIEGVTIIDDTYNASPDSMRSSLSVLWARECKGKRYAVLADALELGENSKELHEEVGRYIIDEARKGNITDCLVTVGEQASYISNVVLQSNIPELSHIQVKICDNREDATKYLKENLSAGDTIMLKGSRGMKMDEIVKALL